MTLEVYGYPSSGEELSRPWRLKEISFAADPQTLREVAKFLVESADLLEKHGVDFSHEHFQDWWPEWEDELTDIIVCNPNP